MQRELNCELEHVILLVNKSYNKEALFRKLLLNIISCSRE